MLSQFSREGDNKALADLKFNFPKDAYPVGRLDSDSEGLLLITNDKSINHKLLDPKFKHTRTYLAQVEGIFSEEAKIKLEKGISISVDGKAYKTLPCHVKIIPSPEGTTEHESAKVASVAHKVGARNPPIRFRKNIPTSWIEISLHEGKNRQVRKMTASVGFPTLRLIRTAIEKIELGSLQPGEVKELSKEDCFAMLKIA